MALNGHIALRNLRTSQQYQATLEYSTCTPTLARIRATYICIYMEILRLW
jgi:hypothetical protein